MTPDELRAIMEFLRECVQLEGRGDDGAVIVRFDAPTADEMAGRGLNADGSRRILSTPWWDEMVTDIVETRRCAIWKIHPSKCSPTPRTSCRVHSKTGRTVREELRMDTNATYKASEVALPAAHWPSAKAYASSHDPITGVALLVAVAGFVDPVAPEDRAAHRES